MALPASLPSNTAQTQAELVYKDRVVPYTLRRSARARCLRVEVHPRSGVTVVAPMRAPPSAIERFLAGTRLWIFRQVDRLSARRAGIPPYWPHGPTLPFLGKDYPVGIEPCGQRGPSSVALHDERLIVRVRQDTPETARRALRNWYMTQAQIHLEARTAFWAPRLSAAYRYVHVGNARSRWGSCSATGVLRYNYRLVMAPPEIVDYVVVHELAHTRQLNHSPRFWAIVAEHSPDYAAARIWLRTRGLFLTL